MNRQAGFRSKVGQTNYLSAKIEESNIAIAVIEQVIVCFIPGSICNKITEEAVRALNVHNDIIFRNTCCILRVADIDSPITIINGIEIGVSVSHAMHVGNSLAGLESIVFCGFTCPGSGAGMAIINNVTYDVVIPLPTDFIIGGGLPDTDLCIVDLVEQNPDPGRTIQPHHPRAHRSRWLWHRMDMVLGYDHVLALFHCETGLFVLVCQIATDINMVNMLSELCTLLSETGSAGIDLHTIPRQVI